MGDLFHVATPIRRSIELRGFRHRIRAVATEVRATVVAHDLTGIVHRSHADVAHLRMLVRLPLPHVAATGVVPVERVPVDPQNDPVGTGVHAVGIRPGRNSRHRNTTDEDRPTVGRQVVLDVVVAKLQ